MNGTHEAAPTAGLRERKKQRTRDALLRAALELFVTQGYEQTTVDEIAAAVDVSQRTFFRYFAGKEEAAFAVQDMVEAHFVAELRRRPADEPPLEALRSTLVDSWNTLGEAISAAVPLDLHMRTFQLIESTPVLLAGHLRRSTELEDRVARVVAEREGIDMDADPRPRVAVAAFVGVMRLIGRMWGAGNDLSVASIRDLTVSRLDLLGPALTGSWRTDDATGAPHTARTAATADTARTAGTGNLVDDSDSSGIADSSHVTHDTDTEAADGATDVQMP